MLDLFRLVFRWRPHGDSLLTAHLAEACEQPGCPICRLVAGAILRSLESLLYECVNDAGTARRLRASRGFCTEHTWAVPVAAAAVHSATGVATIYERLLADLLYHAATEAGLARWLQPAAACPVCLTVDATTSAYQAELARLLAGRGFGPALDGLPFVLCRPHLRAIAPAVDPAAAATLTAATDAALATARPRDRIALHAAYCPVGPLPAHTGCPVCRAANDASVATEGVAALCRRHAWDLFDLGRDDVAAALRDCVPAEACPACRAGAAAVAAAIDEIEDERLLCLGHLRLAVGRGWLARGATFTALLRLDEDLSRFRDSADYRFTGTLNEAERRSWITVLARFGGESVGASLAREPAQLPRERGAQKVRA
jgi:hypothetical protein